MLSRSQDPVDSVSCFPRPVFTFRSLCWFACLSIIFGCGTGRVWAAQTQTITFAALTDQTYGAAPFTVSATASSGLAVSFASTTSSVCSVSVSTVSLLASGTCTIKATQAGNSSYAAAPPVSQSFTVHHASQTITFASIPTTPLATGSVSLTATASSGLAVSFASTTASVCTASGSTAALLAGGTCTITATQAGDAQYFGPVTATRSFTVAVLAQQSITFAALPDQTYGAAPFTVSATASSGLAVSFASTTSSVCSVSASSVSLLASGTCTIKATQAGNSSYGAAPPVSQSFTVHHEAQTISFSAIPTTTLTTGSVNLAATASSGLPVSLASTTPSVCTVSGSVATLLAIGTCTINASQAGNAQYGPTSAAHNFAVIALMQQSITFAPLAAQTYGVAPFAVSATASSGLPVSFASTTSSICTVAGNLVTVLASGNCTINATQAGNTEYAAAAAVSQTFSVHHAAQTISFATIPATTLSAGSVSLSATASSGLPVSFASATESVCSVSGNTATPVAVGYCTINATQAGNAQYASATVSHVLQVNNLAPTIIGQSPQFAIAGTASQNVTLTGQNFLPGITATFAGAAHTVTFVNSTTVVLPLTSADLLASGVQIVALTNPAPSVGARTISFPVLYETDGMLAASQLAAGDQARLQRLIQKGRNGEPVTMVTIGGSITAGGDVSNPAHYYGSLLQDWWNATFPTSIGTLVNAGLGGTASDYGSLRAQRDVLSYNPDLVVVEFAINDHPPSLFTDPYEGLVRQLLDAPSHPAVILLFMMTYQLPIVESDVTAQPWQSAIGANYNVPMVSYFDAIGPELTNGNITLAQITPDDVHPNDLGHAYAAQFLEQNLQLAIDNFPSGTALEPIPATEAPLYSSDFEFTSLVEGNGTWGPPLNPTSNQGWVQVSTSPGGQLNFPDAGLQSSTAGSTLDFTVTGKEILVGYWVNNAPMGQASVTVDGGAPATLDGFSATSNGDHTMYQAATGLADGPHQVQIQLLSTKDSGSTGNTFDLLTVGAGGVYGSEQQSITFAALPNQEYGTAPFTVSATASSGLTVSFASTTPSVCSVSGSTVSLLSVGTCTINAAQSGNSTYGAATPVSQSFTVSRGAQTISFAALPAVTYGAAPLSLAATASSALPVSFASTSSSVCTVSGSTVSLLAAGTCTIDASQTGNTDYAAATVVSQSFAVHHEAQTISFAVIPATTLVTGSVSLNATASSGLPVTFTSTTASLCTVSGSTATLLAVGTCNVTASQAGSAQYGSTASSRGLVITLAPQSISFAAIPSMTFGASPFGVTATASSGLPVAFSSATPAICTVSGNTVTAAVSGFCGITANQAGNYEYSAAPAMIQSFTVTNTALNVTGYSPQFVVGGSAGQNITVTGSGFQPSTTATYGGVAHSITYVNGNTMVLPLTSGDLASVGVEPIVLSNATPAGAWLVNLPVLYETSATLANSQLAAGDQARLENLIVKGRSGKPVTIATIGGSITEGVGASDVEHSYASLLQDWWNQTFPTSASTLVNAGISGTASDYGSMRLQRDVLSKNPDLVVVEFAVNDNVPNEFFGDTYEGVVRQLLDAPSHPAVMLLFMMTYELPVVESDVTAQPLQSSIGTNYDVPMVSYYNAISTEMTNGNLTIAQLTADGVHPTDLGHAYAAQFLEQDLQNAINNFAPGTTPEAIPQTAGAVYSTDFEFTSLEEGNGSWGSPLTPSNNQGWVQVAEAPEGTLIFPDEGLQTSTPGSTLSFTVSGKDLFIGYWLLNGPMGQINVSVDGGTPVLRDGYYADVTPSCSPTLCTSGYHTMYRLATGLADGPHQVQIQLLSTKDSGSTGNTFDLLTVGAGGVF